MRGFSIISLVAMWFSGGLTGLPAGAQTQELDAACNRPLGDIVAVRDFSLAYFCAAERMQIDPEDTEALLVFARAAQELGQWEIALDYAKRARALGIDGGDLFASYLISGMAEAGRGHMLAARLNLRRGGDFAPDARAKGIISTALEQVDTASPLHFSLHFSVNPDSNINGGSLHDTFRWLGLEIALDADARAQAGIGYSLGGDVVYETALGAHMLWENRLSLSGTVYDGRGRNDLRVLAQSGLKYSPPAGDPSLWYGSVTLEKRWIGAALGMPLFGEYSRYTTTTTLALERHWQPGEGRLGSLYANYTWRQSDTGGQDAGIVRLGGSYRFPLAGGAMYVGGYLEDTDSLDAGVAAQSVNTSLGYSHHFDAPELAVSARVQFTHTQFKEQLFGYAGIRRDDAVSLELAVTPKAWQWYGFSPRFGVDITRNLSNHERHDTGGLRVFTEIRSAF